jgi:hypothetical protein
MKNLDESVTVSLRRSRAIPMKKVIVFKENDYGEQQTGKRNGESAK